MAQVKACLGLLVIVALMAVCIAEDVKQVSPTAEVLNEWATILTEEEETSEVDQAATEGVPVFFLTHGWRRHSSGKCFYMRKRAKHCPWEAKKDCSSPLKKFAAADTPEDALVMAWLVGDLSALTAIKDTAAAAAAQASLKEKWAKYGAESITIRTLSEKPTYGASFSVGGTTFLIFSWTIGDVDAQGRSDTVPYQGSSDLRVLEAFYEYFEQDAVQQVFTDARSLGKSSYVLAGNSAGSALAQYGALDLTGVKGVYLFGAERFGNGNFQDFYTSERGSVTRSWWNKFDVWPIVPAIDDDEQELVDAATCPGEGPTYPLNNEDDLQSLPNSVRWRIGPNDGKCQKMTTTLAEPCAGADTCTLTCADHDFADYFDNIKACVSDKCLKDLKLTQVIVDTTA